MTLSLEEVKKPGNRDSLAEALRNLADVDNDFNGNNGEDYLWDEAHDKGFTSNLDYSLNDAFKKRKDISILISFLGLWLDEDSYYSDYDYEVLYDENGNIKTIALALED